jgi:hypothetical protein
MKYVRGRVVPPIDPIDPIDDIDPDDLPGVAGMWQARTDHPLLLTPLQVEASIAVAVRRYDLTTREEHQLLLHRQGLVFHTRAAVREWALGTAVAWRREHIEYLGEELHAARNTGGPDAAWTVPSL